MRSLIARFFPSSCYMVTLKYIHKVKRLYLRNGMLDNFVPPHPARPHCFLLKELQRNELHTRWAPHFVLPVRACLENHYSFRLIGRRGRTEFSMRIPNLTSCEFFLCGWKNSGSMPTQNKNTGKPGKKFETLLLQFFVTF